MMYSGWLKNLNRYRHGMISTPRDKRKCRHCDWWDNQHISVQYIVKLEWKPNPGFCRKHKPGAILIDKNHIGVQPVMDADESCGEFRIVGS